jgi:hypothetical protein
MADGREVIQGDRRSLLQRRPRLIRQVERAPKWLREVTEPPADLIDPDPPYWDRDSVPYGR